MILGLLIAFCLHASASPDEPMIEHRLRGVDTHRVAQRLNLLIRQPGAKTAAFYSLTRKDETPVSMQELFSFLSMR